MISLTDGLFNKYFLKINMEIVLTIIILTLLTSEVSALLLHKSQSTSANPNYQCNQRVNSYVNIYMI